MKTTPRTIVCTLTAALALGFASSVFAGQPHMDKAIEHLEAAKAELKEAEANKGGWRISAMKTIEDVIQQIRNGEDAAKDGKGGKKKKN